MDKLTVQEEQAMQAIWRIQGGFIKELLGVLEGEEVPYTTLASTVKNLEKKGFVKAVRYANAKRYEALITEESYKAGFMQSFVGDYFQNSYKDMVSFFIKERKLNPEELAEIMQMIEQESD
ncbi:BlaI/MecI/CopY family transcriptional regulator [Sphingobacteriaceae bacterium WQ 2009]|uniref:BlaI/MecI/CopY family transcriptional regulator n=1 Tax=Rhinopithecimicrobium faecis TaxID=2820698 RepID=A0A8T4H7F8_9SPHI|nr:BlaI/MecI/CopY family transcriptional regulator [Sphingobacteriaceae bacterium WQ 2009]